MKKILFLAIMLTPIIMLRAQDAAIDGMMKYDKGADKHSSTLELPYTPEVVENAIKENMAKNGIKGERKKDIQIYRGVKLGDGDELSDLYFKVERKSRKDKNVSVVNLIVAHANENVALGTGNDVARSEQGKTFLNGITPSVAAYSLDENIKDQEKEISKAEKKLKNYQDDQKEYEKKISDFQDKLAQNKKDQEAQTVEIQKQRSIRDAMNARRTQ